MSKKAKKKRKDMPQSTAERPKEFSLDFGFWPEAGCYAWVDKKTRRLVKTET